MGFNGGNSSYSYISQASVNATVQSTSGGNIYGIQCGNINAAPRYLKLYDQATTPGASNTPVLVVMIPGNTSGAGNNVPCPIDGIKFVNGIAFTITGGIANNDATAILASEVVINFQY